MSIVYRYLNIVVSFQFCIANGVHIANAISPLLNVFNVYGYEHNNAYLLGSVGMAIGLFTLGGRVLETIGKKVIVLDFQKAFCA